jgi:hypothetical protein
MGPTRPPPPPGSVVVRLDGPIARSGIPPLCDRVRAVLALCAPALLICDVGAIAEPDVVLVEALAWLQLTALRLGSRMLLRSAGGNLEDLLCLCGLTGAIPAEGGLRFGLPLEPLRQPEQREQPLGVEEERDP